MIDPLRKAAEELIKEWDWECGEHQNKALTELIETLRQALAQLEQNKLLKQGWRQCAIGQRTTQYCGMAEQARLEEREACARLIEDWDSDMMDPRDGADAIRARGEK